MIEELIAESMAAKSAEGTEASIRFCRFLHAMRARLLQGTGFLRASAPCQGNAVEEWMAKLGFKSATERDSDGWTPLFYAVIEGRVDVATWLLDAGAEVKGVLRKADPNVGAEKGLSVLHVTKSARAQSHYLVIRCSSFTILAASILGVPVLADLGCTRVIDGVWCSFNVFERRPRSRIRARCTILAVPMYLRFFT